VGTAPPGASSGPLGGETNTGGVAVPNLAPTPGAATAAGAAERKGAPASAALGPALPSLRTALVFVPALIALATLAYGININFINPTSAGFGAATTRAGAERQIRRGYASIQRGIATPDADQLIDYVPVHLKRAPTLVDINAKNDELRKQGITCD